MITIKINEISLFFALIGGLLGNLLGGFDGFLKCLIAFVVMDVITGVLCAGQKGHLASAVGFRGILKKVLIFMVVAMGASLDGTLISHTGAPLRLMIIGFYLANEGLSILENLGRLGVPLPKRLIQVIKGLGEEDEQDKKEH